MTQENIKALGRLRHTFSLSEMQATVGGAMGSDLRKTHLADCLSPQLDDSQSALSSIIKQHRLNVNGAALVQKLEAIEPQDLIVLQDTVAKILESYEETPSSFFGVKDLPCVNVLRVAGLVAPSDKAAWGFIVVMLDEERYFEQIVLRDRPDGQTKSTLSVVEHSERLVEIVRSHAAKAPIAPANAAYQEGYALTRASGWRFARVRSKTGVVTVAEISVEDLQSDLRDGSLHDIVLEGVNAPLSGA